MFYSELYSEGEVHVNKDEIIKSIETVTKIVIRVGFGVRGCSSLVGMGKPVDGI